MKNYVFLLAATLCVGCENGELALTDEARSAVKAKVKKRGEAMHKQFVLHDKFH